MRQFLMINCVPCSLMGYKILVRKTRCFLGMFHQNTCHVCQAQRFGTLRLAMMTSSNGNIFRVTGPLCREFSGPAEFPAQWPVTRSFDVVFDQGLNKRLSKQTWGWWFETQPWSLWRQYNALNFLCRIPGRISVYMIYVDMLVIFNFLAE